MDRRRAGAALLALCGYRAGETAGGLAPDEWRDVDRLAEEHRLQPFLYGRLIRDEIPPSVPEARVEAWRASHRANGIAVLAQRRALAQAAEALRGIGVEPVALKGSALAWSAWPSPAERVMRDIDLLVPQDRVIDAYAALRAGGWDAPDAAHCLLERMADEETHLPALYSPDGVMCELHAHVWAKAPLGGLAMPPSDDAAFLARAVRDEELGVLVPSGEDMLAHLVVHGALSHLFNVGPLALLDFDFALAAHLPDWVRLAERAKQGGYIRALVLMVTLVDKWLRPGLLDECRLFNSAAPEIVEQAEMLLVQDPAARKDINAIAGISLGGNGAGRLRQHPLDEAEGPTGMAARIGQLAGRGVSIAGSLLDRDIRNDGLATADLARWMSEG